MAERRRLRTEAADWHEYRRLQDAQQRRYERAGVGGGQEEYDQYFGRGEHAGNGVERRLTPQEWMRWSRQPTFDDLPVHEQEWHHGYELGESHGNDADRADFQAMDRAQANSAHPEHFYRGYVEGLHAGLEGNKVNNPRFAVRIGYDSPPAQEKPAQRFARLLSQDMPGVIKLAHDSGDPQVIFHCCFCGSGQVVARSDGSVECGFCRVCFTVQIQPQYAAFPQTIDGVPVQVPGMGPQWPGQDDADTQRAQQAQEGVDVPEDEDGTDGNLSPSPPDDGDSDDTDEPDKTGNPFAKKSYRSARGDTLTEDQLLRHVALETTRDRTRMLRTIRTRGVRKTAFELPESVDVGGGERAKVITDEHARGDSQPVSLEEFTEHAREGKHIMDEHRAHAEHPHGLYDPENWEKIKQHTHGEIQKSWGGATIDAHSGEPLDSHADAYAITVKPPRTDSVTIHESPSYEDWSQAMDHARDRFHGVLRNRNHHLGVFHDDDLKRVDIDPVVISHDRDEAAKIGAYTHNIGGAYNFKDGNGYWPVHVPRHHSAASVGAPMPFQGIGHWYAHAASL